MNVATQIYLALAIDKSPALRRIAASVACRYWMEMHRYGEFRAATLALNRLMLRFRLGDFVLALSAHYPIRKTI